MSKRITPLPFQEKAKNRIVKFFEEHNVYLLADETGLGKTVISSEVIRQMYQNRIEKGDCSPFRVMYIASSLDLAKDNIRKLQIYDVNDKKLVQFHDDRLTVTSGEKEDSAYPIHIYTATPAVTLSMTTKGTKNEKSKVRKNWNALSIDENKKSEILANDSLKELYDETCRIVQCWNKVWDELKTEVISETGYVDSEVGYYLEEFWNDPQFGRRQKPKYLKHQFQFFFEYNHDLQLVTELLLDIIFKKQIWYRMQYQTGEITPEIDSILQTNAVKARIDIIRNAEDTPYELIGYIDWLWNKSGQIVVDNGNENSNSLSQFLFNNLWEMIVDGKSFIDDLLEEINAKATSVVEKVNQRLRYLLCDIYEVSFYKSARRFMCLDNLYKLKPEMVIIDEIQNYPEIFTDEVSDGDELAKCVLDAILGKNITEQTGQKVLMLSATPYAYRSAIEVRNDNTDDSEEAVFVQHLVGMDEILTYMKNRNGLDVDIFSEWKSCQEELNGLLKSGNSDILGLNQVKEKINHLSLHMKELGISRTERPLKSFVPSVIDSKDRYLISVSDVSLNELTDFYVNTRSSKYSRLTLSLPRNKSWYMEEGHKGVLNEYKGLRVDSDGSNKETVHVGLKVEKSEDDENGRLEGHGSARIKALLEDLLDGGLYKLLFIPPTIKNHHGVNSEFPDYGKTVLFSAYNAVPATLSMVIEEEVYSRLEKDYKELSADLHTVDSQAEGDELTYEKLVDKLVSLLNECGLDKIFGNDKKYNLFLEPYAIKVLASIYGTKLLVTSTWEKTTVCTCTGFISCVYDYCKKYDFEGVIKEYEYATRIQKLDGTDCVYLTSAAGVDAGFSYGFTSVFSSSRVGEKGADFVRDLERFNSPFYPFCFLLTSVAQEGHDFHWYADRIVHWNVPSSPIALIQREGRIDRCDCLAVRKSIAGFEGFKNQELALSACAWEEIYELFKHMYVSKYGKLNTPYSDMFPSFITGEHENAVKRFCYYYPYSEEYFRWEILMKNLEFYRSMFGAYDITNRIGIKDLLDRDDEYFREVKSLKIDLYVGETE